MGSADRLSNYDLQSLVGRPILPERPDATIGEVRETEGGILLTIRWDSVPFIHEGKFLGMTTVATTWLYCADDEPNLILELVSRWVHGEHDDPRISDAEPPQDVPCGGWLAPDGTLLRGSEYTHPILAKRIVQGHGLSLGMHDSEQWLEAHGWMHVLDSGSAWPSNTMTQSQRDALFDLATRFPAMRDRIMSVLKEDE